MTPSANIRRSPISSTRAILQKQIAAALADLERRVISDSSIHSSRKKIKKARATLRLIRDELPEETFRSQNLALRDAARPLNAIRDAKILIDALDRLVKPRSVKATAIEAFRRALIRSRNRAQASAMTAKTGILQSRRMLRAAHAATIRWPARNGGWPVLRNGLKRTYSRGRREFADARRKQSVERLHEWRKHVKYLWHQLQVLEPIRPGPVGKLAGRAHKLSDHLGDDHDLAVLREHVGANKAAFGNAATSTALLTAIDRSREALQAKALALGSRLYAVKAAQFASRFDRYFRATTQDPDS